MMPLHMQIVDHGMGLHTLCCARPPHEVNVIVFPTDCQTDIYS